jgi:hypothetical protein
MFKLLLLLTTTVLFSKQEFNDSFITKYEYGKMLYNNPRGISCTKCHGIDAKGKKIASFKHIRNKKVYNCTIKSNNITNISYEKFIKVLDPKLKKDKVIFKKTDVCKKLTFRNSMPTYFLTNDELKSIHFYITNQDKYDE